MRNWQELVITRDLANLVKWTGDWRREKGFITGWSNFPEKLMLIITELNEASDAFTAELGDLYTVDKENLIEEWIDVCVRTIDLMEACDLNIRESIADALRGEGDPESHEYYKFCLDENRLTLEEIIKQCCWFCTQQLADAMECFRDLHVERGKIVDDHERDEKSVIANSKTTIKMSNISTSLSTILFEAYSVINYLDRDWWQSYVDKMIINEERPTKHGRQR